MNVVALACAGNADDMGETCACWAGVGGSSRLTEVAVMLGPAVILGVAGVPPDDETLPIYHDCCCGASASGGV